MTKTLLVFPRAERTQLNCKWIETGNPNCPLVCVWLDRATASTTAVSDGEQVEATDERRFHLPSGHLCA